MSADQAAPPDLSAFSPEYINEIRQNNAGIAVGALFVFLAVLTTILRVWSRIRSIGRLKLDDYLLFGAVAFMLSTYAASVSAVTAGGFGRHMPVVVAEDPHILEHGLLMMFFIEFVYIASLFLTKISLLVMYYSIFPTVFMKRSAIALGVLLAAFVLAAYIVTVFQCKPIDYAWAIFKYPEGGKCINNNSFFIGSSIPNITTDVLILMLPAYEVSRLHMQRAQKLGVTAIFLVGIFVVVVSIIRLKALFDYASLNNQDITYDIYLSWLFSVLEVSVAVIAACLPTLRPLFRRLFGGALSRSRHADQGDDDGLPTIRTIGGGITRHPRTTGFGGVSGSGGRSNVLKTNVTTNSTTTTAAHGLGSLERLQHESDGGDEPPGLTPRDYTNQRTTTINNKRDSSSITAEDIPLDAIYIKTDVTWEESVREKR